MHITERLGLNHGRPVTADESEILAACEHLLSAEDASFLRWGPTLTVTSDLGLTILSIAGADRFGAKIRFVLVPPASLTPSQVTAVIAAVSAEEESEQKLLVFEHPGQPLMVVATLDLLRPFAQEDLHRAYRDFAYLTQVAIGRAISAMECGANATR